MKKALINRATLTLHYVHPDIPSAPIAAGCEWVDCADDVRPETHNFDGVAFVLKHPQAPDHSDIDRVQKQIKALGLVVAAWSGKTPAQLKAAFKQAYDSLP